MQCGDSSVFSTEEHYAALLILVGIIVHIVHIVIDQLNYLPYAKMCQKSQNQTHVLTKVFLRSSDSYFTT